MVARGGRRVEGRRRADGRANAATAGRSEIRGTITEAWFRTARRSAFAIKVSRLLIETRTLTPELWLTSGASRAAKVNRARIDFMKGGKITVRPARGSSETS